MTDIQRICLDEVVLHFAELEDPRSTVNRRHPLVSVVVIAVLAVLSGASGPTAMGAKKAIAADIIDGGGDFVLALKGNQGALHQAVIEHIDEQLEGELEGAQELVTTEKGHGRVETRTYLQLPAPKELPGLALWKGLKTIAIVTSLCIRDGKETSEVRYYISSLAMGVKQLARAVRGHWGIENSCHWILDVTYREDESRIREETRPYNISWLSCLPIPMREPDSGSKR